MPVLVALFLTLIVAAGTTAADPLPPDPFEAATTDAAIRHSRAYREWSNERSLRGLGNNAHRLIVKTCLERIQTNAELGDICVYHLKRAGHEVLHD